MIRMVYDFQKNPFSSTFPFNILMNRNPLSSLYHHNSCSAGALLRPLGAMVTARTLIFRPVGTASGLV